MFDPLAITVLTVFKKIPPTFLHDRFLSNSASAAEIFRLVPERRSLRGVHSRKSLPMDIATFIRGINELMNISPMFLSACGAIDRRRVRLNSF